MPKSSSLTTTKAAKPRKPKQGLSLEALLLVWHGTEIPRSPEGRINLSAMVRASNAFTGENKRLRDWQRLAATRDYLAALAAAKAVSGESLIGPEKARESSRVLPAEKALTSEQVSTAGIPADESSAPGSRTNDTWGDADVATELAQWLHVELRVAVNRWVRGELTRKRRPRPLDAASAAIVRGRKDGNAWLSEEVHKRGYPPALIHRQLTHALTGSAPEIWEAKLGSRWQEHTSIQYQLLQQMAASTAANHISALPTDSTKRHLYASCRTAASISCRMFGLDRVEPTYEGPAFTPRRLQLALKPT